jgi:hydrogenase-4 component F
MVGALLAGGLTSVAFLALLRTMQIMAAAGELEIARRAFLLMGVLSLLFAALFVVRQPDFKRLLAYSSVEHMGILAIGIGIGGIAIFGAMLHMVNNALVKGVLFLTAGNIHRRFASKRREEVAGAIAVLPASAALFIAGFLAVTGSPPFGLFVSELAILRAALSGERVILAVLFLLLLAAAFIGITTTALRMAQGEAPAAVGPARPEPASATWPPLALLLAALLLGLYQPPPLAEALAAAARLTGGF